MRRTATAGNGGHTDATLLVKLPTKAAPPRKLIVSPEFGDRMDLERLTGKLMQSMQRDLGRRLEWVAVSHFNTHNPHIHIALRGMDMDGNTCRLERDYVQHSIRGIADDLCTHQLSHFVVRRTSVNAKHWYFIARLKTLETMGCNSSGIDKRCWLLTPCRYRTHDCRWSRSTLGGAQRWRAGSRFLAKRKRSAVAT